MSTRTCEHERRVPTRGASPHDTTKGVPEPTRRPLVGVESTGPQGFSRSRIDEFRIQGGTGRLSR